MVTRFVFPVYLQPVAEAARAAAAELGITVTQRYETLPDG